MVGTPRGEPSRERCERLGVGDCIIRLDEAGQSVFGIIGAGVSLVAVVVVTLATPELDEEIQKMVDEVRIPKGNTILSSDH